MCCEAMKRMPTRQRHHCGMIFAGLLLLSSRWSMAQPPRYDGWQLVNVTVSTRADFDALLALQDGSREFEIWTDRPGLGEVLVRIAPGWSARLNEAGLRFRVVVEDLQAYYDEQASAQRGGDFFDYERPYDEVVAYMDSLAASSPLVEMVTIGTSVQGRPLRVLHITGTAEGKPGVFYHGAQHGFERIGTPAVLFLAHHLVTGYGVSPDVTALVDNVDFYLLPMMNPDGYVDHGRYNARGVDLNRNWDGPTGETGYDGGPCPFSEPETAAIRDFLLTRPNIKAHIDFHGYVRMILWPWGYTPGYALDHYTFALLGNEMRDRIYAVGGTPYEAGPGYTTIYPTVGDSTGYTYGELGLWGFVIELDYAAWPAPTSLQGTCQDILPAMLYLAEWVSDCNGNGQPDALDISSGASTDCNVNGIPDTCEHQGDCNGDGTLDICDFAAVPHPDCNANAMPDTCDVADGSTDDCDGNLVPDECDPDCNANDVVDACEIGAGVTEDCNGNLVPDECEPDCNANGITDACDIVSGASDDCDANGVPDECQPDCNRNHVADVCDLAAGNAQDDNGNGVPDACEDVWHVDDDAVPGGDGRSWRRAFADLRDALRVADRADIIRVAEGEYTPDLGTGDESATFELISGVALLGGYAGGHTANPDSRDPGRFVTNLSGRLTDEVRDDGPGDRARSNHVVTAVGADASTVLDGFTISGGANLGGGLRRGAGILIESSYLTIRNCVVRDNEADDEGGGVWIGGGGPVFVDCVFTVNAAGDGGAVYASASRPVFTRCLFSQNSALFSAGAVRNVGSDTVFEQCRFINNVAYAAGAMLNWSSSPRIQGSSFIGNVSTSSANRGGAIVSYEGSAPTVADCAFIGNSAAAGGAIYSELVAACAGEYAIVNCTFWANHAHEMGGALLFKIAPPILRNCIFINNVDGDGAGETSQIRCVDRFTDPQPVVDHSCIQGWTGDWGGTGNFDADPMFVDPIGPDGVAGTEDDDVRLLSDSPCINAGDPDFVATQDHADLGGHARVLCERVDIGAHEFGVGDYDCDRLVDLIDFSAWATCMSGPGNEHYPAGCRAFDFALDADVDLADAAALMNVISSAGPP